MHTYITLRWCNAHNSCCVHWSIVRPTDVSLKLPHIIQYVYICYVCLIWNRIFLYPQWPQCFGCQWFFFSCLGIDYEVLFCDFLWNVRRRFATEPHQIIKRIARAVIDSFMDRLNWLNMFTIWHTYWKKAYYNLYFAIFIPINHANYCVK